MKPTRHFGEIRQGDRVHRAQVVAIRAAVGDLDLGMPGLERPDARGEEPEYRTARPKILEKSHGPPG